jgi:hypothetical protein
VILDEFSHFTWSFPLRHKSDVLPTLIAFHAFVLTQFQHPIMCLQTDNDKKFDNHTSRSFFSAQGIFLRLTCPYTSQKNGRAERTLRTLNDSMCTMLLHASTPLSFWPDALAMATYLRNHQPCRVRQHITPHELLLGHATDYSHLRVFVSLCYPNTTATTPHKLAPHNIPCVFLSYSAESKGYRCYNPSTRRVITSSHVYFNEIVFPFRSSYSTLVPMDSPLAPPCDMQFVSAPLPQRRWCLPALPPPLAHAPASPLATTAAPAEPPLTKSSMLMPPYIAPHVAEPNTPLAPPSEPFAETDAQPPDPAPSAPMHNDPNVSPEIPVATPPPSRRTTASASTAPRHPMIMRARDGIQQPNPRYTNIAVTTPSPTPSSIHAALRDPDWRSAMEAEFHTLQENQTWTLIPQPPDINVISGKWLFKNKLNLDGTLERRKAH